MSKYKTEINHKKETYNWETYVPVGATKLFIGTFHTKEGINIQTLMINIK
jgi:hypothetical protein